MNLDSLQLGIRYSVTGMATRSYVILYIMIKRVSMRLLSNWRQWSFWSIYDTLDVRL